MKGSGPSQRRPSAATNALWGDDWPTVRGLWSLDPEVAHCNHGSFGAVPAPVLAVQDELRRRMVVNPMAFFGRELPEAVRGARARLAAFLGAGAEEVALVANATTAVSTVLASLTVPAGSAVVSTDHAYGAVALAVERFCAQRGAENVVVRVPAAASDEEVLAAVGGRLGAGAALLVVDHITSATAKRLPVEALAKLAHEHGVPVLVDGAHVPGQLPVRVAALGADFWTGNFHKWACAPAGTAALWVAPDWREKILPLVVSHDERAGFPSAFDWLGTDDRTAWAAAPAALDLLGELGWERVHAHNASLVRHGQAVVGEALGVHPGALRHDAGLGMAVVPVPRRWDDPRAAARAARKLLVERGVEASLPVWDGAVTVRLSAHAYNCPADYERLALGLRELMVGD